MSPGRGVGAQPRAWQIGAIIKEKVLVDQRNDLMSGSKSYEEIIDFIASGTTPEAVVAFRPSSAARQRVAELSDRSKEGSITAEEQSELEDFLQLEHIMIMAKARARQRTHLGK